MFQGAFEGCRQEQNWYSPALSERLIQLHVAASAEAQVTTL